MADIQINNLTKEFEDTVAVNDLNLNINDGELVALLGPSGCGKTTTLRMIAGLIECTEGDIRVNDESILKVPPEKRNIGMVFQRYVLFPHMTVGENIGFGLKMRKCDPAKIEKEVDKVLDTVQMKKLKNRYPHELSGGQQQRVAIARALIIEPQIFLMDEPLANLDAKLREEMRIFLRDLQRELGITTIFVTHDQSEATVLADRIAVIFDGVLHQFDTPRKVFKNPANRKVAKFTGFKNFIEGTFEGDNVFSTDIGDIYTDDNYNSVFNEGDGVILALRAEHISVTPTEGDKKNSFPFKVIENIFQGGTVRYRLISNDIYIEAFENRDYRLKKDDEVFIGFDPGEVVVLK